MAFLLYDVSQTDSYKHYKLVKKISLAGQGPLASIVKKRFHASSAPVPWHISSSDIIAEISGSPDSQEILIDLKPSVKKNISLYQLCDIWGYSYDEWTPVALLLESIFVDREIDDPAQFKRQFDDREAVRTRLGEFLYLQGGVNKGTWVWGPIGTVNGALLWKDAFTFLTSELAKHI